MKTRYYFTKISGKRSKRTGANTLYFQVLTASSTRIVCIGLFERSSNSYPGDETAVMQFLVEKECLHKRNNGYYKENTSFAIEALPTHYDLR